MSRISPLFTWRSAIAEADLQPRAKLVALTLSLYMSELGDSCYPSLATLKRNSGLSKSTVALAIQDLIDAGYLSKNPGGKGQGGRGKSTRYFALIPPPKEVSDQRTDTDESVRSPNESVRPAAEKCPPTGQEYVSSASAPRAESVRPQNQNRTADPAILLQMRAVREGLFKGGTSKQKQVAK